MENYMFYCREIIKNHIEDNRPNIDYVECFINGYYEDTCGVIFRNNEYTFDINSEKLIVSNTICVQGLKGSYKAEPTMRIYLKDGSQHEFTCFEIKQQTDITNELGKVIKELKDKGIIKLELKANRDIIEELNDILSMITRTK